MTTYDTTYDADFDDSASDVAVEIYPINAGEVNKMQTLEQRTNKYQDLISWAMEPIQFRRAKEYETKFGLYQDIIKAYKAAYEAKKVTSSLS